MSYLVGCFLAGFLCGVVATLAIVYRLAYELGQDPIPQAESHGLP